VTYREDHDAALARIAALEQQLADQQRKTRDAEARARDAERERDHFAREVTVLRGDPSSPSRPAPPPSGDIQLAGRRARIAVGLVVVLAIAAGITRSVIRHTSRPALLSGLAEVLRASFAR